MKKSFLTLLANTNKMLNLSDSAMVILTGMVIVLMTLILLIIIFWAFGKIMTQKSQKTNNKNHNISKETIKETDLYEISQEYKADNTNDALPIETIAVISAAVAAMQTDDVKYSIKDIKPISEKVFGKRPIWATAGLLNITKPF